MNISYTLIRTKRRSISLQIQEDASLVVRAPLRTPLSFIEDFIEQKKEWIKKNQIKIQLKEKKKEYSEKKIQEMKKKLRIYIIPKLEKIWKENILPKYTSVKITKSETRWGSCSGKNTLCFSYRLAEYLENGIGIGKVHTKENVFVSGIKEKGSNLGLCTPPMHSSFIDAIIVHELAHLKEKNHQKPFWDLVYSMMADYEDAIKIGIRSISQSE